MWYRFAIAPILLSNPIVGGFWIKTINLDSEEDDSEEIEMEFIDYGDELNKKNWKRKLKTDYSKISTQENLNDFLNKSKFEITSEGEKIYIPGYIHRKEVLLINPIIGGFLVKDQNEFIEYGKPLNTSTWRDLLNTSFYKINTQEKLNNYLNNYDFEIIDDVKTYINESKILSLTNPIIGGFLVEEKNKFVEYMEPLNNKEWAELLQTDNRKVNTQEKLNDFLKNADIREVSGTNIYYWKDSRIRLLSNPVEGGFWVDGDFYNESMNAKDWARLLGVTPQKINTQEKLNNYLNNYDFEIIDRKKIYKWIDPKAIIIRNLFGEFYIGDDKIEFGIFKPLNDWKMLLRTSGNNINTQDKFVSFINSNVVNENGIFTYLPPNIRKIELSNPVEDGFIADGVTYNFGQKYSISKWAKILKTSKKTIDSQEKLNDYLLNKTIFKMTSDDKKEYIPYLSRHKGLYLQNPIRGGFLLGAKTIEYLESYGVRDWSRLLNTSQENINTQKKLNDFLSNSIQLDANNNKIYKKPFISARERYFNNNISIDPSLDINYQSQYVIKVPFNGKNRILRFDFVFMKNENILLALELNGGQHYGFIPFKSLDNYDQWQKGLQRDIFKINYCHNNNIPLLIFHHLLSVKDFQTIHKNLSENPHIYDKYIPQRVMDNDLTNTTEEFIRRQIYSHLYPVFSNVISFNNDESKKRYIKDTLILISKLMGIYEGGIDSSDFINEFSRDTDLTGNYNKCLAIYKSLFPDYPIDRDNKITYKDLSKRVQINKPKEIEQDPLDT